MGIALLSAARLVLAMPVWIDRLALQAAWRRLRRPHADRRSAVPQCAVGRRASALRPAPLDRSTTAPRPLRVLRVVDAGQPASGAGRMVISGRLADVCAELERLAAAEDTATHS